MKFLGFFIANRGGGGVAYNSTKERSIAMEKKSIVKRIVALAVGVALMCPVPAIAFDVETLKTDPNNGNWLDNRAVLYNTSEAEMMIRVGDIDSCNGYNVEDYLEDDEYPYSPFDARTQMAHNYPWLRGPEDALGTDTIALGNKAMETDYWGDGYASCYSSFKQWGEEYGDNIYTDGALAISMDYESELAGKEYSSALLQICVDDFQAPSFYSNFKVTLNGKRAQFIEEIINRIDQTGPVCHFVSVIVPSAYMDKINTGKLDIVIDETTGAGDGYAVDFVKLLLNYNAESMNTGVIKGKTMPGATIRLLGSATVVTADASGNFSLNAIPGLSVIRISKSGYVETYQSCIVVKGEQTTVNEGYKVELEKGTGKPDVDYTKYGSAGISESSVTLSQTNLKYTGKALKPKVLSVVNSDDEPLVEGVDYTVSYTKNTYPGTAYAVITGLGDYANIVIKKPFKITMPVLTKPAISSLTKLKKGFTVKWKKKTGVTGYEVRYSTYSTMKYAKTITVKGASTLSKKVTKLKAKKKYYVQLRTYKVVNGKKYVSSWSTKKSVTTK